MLGLAQGAFDYALAYMQRAQAVRQDDRSSSRACEFQYAQVATEIEAARLLVYNAARLKDAGAPFVSRGRDGKAVLVARWPSAPPSTCIELFGGVGFTKEFPVEKLYRDAKIGKIYEGTSNMQLATIAKSLF